VRELRGEDRRLLRAWKAGEARLNGYLEDYACLIEGLLELYQTTLRLAGLWQHRNSPRR